jgi:antitoxin MazE
MINKCSATGKKVSWIARLTIQQWYNNLAIRIPALIALSARFEVGLEVEVTGHGDGITVKRVGPRKLTLAERLERFDPVRHGGEVMGASLTGSEMF